jgi:hypothetical protein
MKILLLIIFVLMPFIGFSQIDTLKTRDIKRLLVLSGSTNNAKIGIEGVINSLKKNTNINNLPEGFWDELTKEIDYEELINIYVPIYEKNYSHQEITDMIVFYESTTGKKMLEKTPLILEESMNLSREWGKKLSYKIYEKIKKNK